MKGPSKKLILILLACVVVVLGIYYLSKTNTEPSTDFVQEKVSPDVIVNEEIKTTSNIDTDGDGLKDWEEILWKTDPLKADSDGNGTPDGKEIENKKQIQNSAQMAQTVGIKKSITTTNTTEGQTLTDQIAMQTFAQYINYKQTGVPITPEYTDLLIKNVLGDEPLKQDIQKFTSKNLKNIVEDENDEVIRSYGNDLWNIIIKNTPRGGGLQNEYVILLTAIQKDDEKELEKLKPIADGYRNSINEMLSMTVPHSAKEKHLDLVNNMNTILALIENMQVYFKDPARGFSAITYYKERVPELKASLENLISYLKEKNITYVEEEGGYSLMHSI